MDTTNRRLVALHCNVEKERRIVFRYQQQRWEIIESIRPWNIREALKISLEKIEEAAPGALAKAAAIDDQNFMAEKLRRRRYIAESPDLLYIDNPHLQPQSEPVAGFHVVTNIKWREVSGILRLACKAAQIEYASFSRRRPLHI